jgi:hypothetical protein
MNHHEKKNQITDQSTPQKPFKTPDTANQSTHTRPELSMNPPNKRMQAKAETTIK